MLCRNCPLSLLCRMSHFKLMPRIDGRNYVFLCPACGRLIYTYRNQSNELTVFTFFCQKRKVSRNFKETIQKTMSIFTADSIEDPIMAPQRLWYVICEKCKKPHNNQFLKHWTELE